MREHGELIAAISSGILIGLGFLLQQQGAETVAVVVFIVSFIVGGYAKAKEGLTETWKSRELNVELLMILAAIGSATIGYWLEGAMLIFIFSLSGALETYTMNRSTKELSSLMELQPEVATRLCDGQEEVVAIADVKVGDTIVVRPGERVAADGEIVFGNTTIDEAAITGEAMPVTKALNDVVYTSTVNLTGVIHVRVAKESSESLFQKIIDLVQSAQSEKSPSQQFIERFESTYVKVVLATVAVMMVAPHFLFGWSWTETIYRAMILLVVASPCALVAAIMPATLAAISNSARKGVLVKGGVHLERLAHIEAIAFDKTGTLTQGRPVVTNEYYRERGHEAALYTIEKQSTHPLAQALLLHLGEQEARTLSEMEDVAGWGVKGTIDHVAYRIGKQQFIADVALTAAEETLITQWTAEGKTLVFAATTELVAIYAFKDELRHETKRAITELNRHNVETVMITGDQEKTARLIAAECGIQTVQANCLPTEKVQAVKQLFTRHRYVAMIGDGINDAPALATATVGIAMGEGTDIALETADIVLMKSNLQRVAETMQLAKKMNRIVKQNIVFSLSVIALLICTNLFQWIDLPLGVIGHEGSTILVILNGLRLLRD